MVTERPVWTVQCVLWVLTLPPSGCCLLCLIGREDEGFPDLPGSPCSSPTKWGRNAARTWEWKLVSGQCCGFSTKVKAGSTGSGRSHSWWVLKMSDFSSVMAQRETDNARSLCWNPESQTRKENASLIIVSWKYLSLLMCEYLFKATFTKDRDTLPQIKAGAALSWWLVGYSMAHQN